jgi:diguanylate cyclase (GGDEF)-like protein
LQTGPKFWIVASAVLTSAQVAATALLPRGFALAFVSDTTSALLMLVLMLASAGNAIPCRGRLRAFWILQAASWCILLSDQIFWILYDLVLRKQMPVVFAGDVLLFLPGVLMLAGLLLRPHSQPSNRSARLGMLDFQLLLLWWVFFYVTLVMCWQFVSSNEALYNRNFDRLYVVEVLVLVAMLSMWLKRSAGAWRRFYVYFLGAVLFNGLSFLLENRAIEQSTYYSGSWYDIPYAASFLSFAIVAMKGRGLTPTPETTEDEKYGSWMASLAVVAVLSLPVIAIAVVLDKWAPPEIVRFRMLVTAVTMFAMAGLLFVKLQRLNEDLKQTNQVLEEASITDPLTGIRNRRFFSATIEADVAQAVRAYSEGHEGSNRDLVFYLIDMDNFKEVNDLHGHDAGDRVLVEAARRITSAIRDSDVLVRWGGEEFLIVSRNTNRKVADALALRVLEAVRRIPFAVSSEVEMRRTCSIGWAAFPWLEENAGEVGYEWVLSLADRALSHAKKAGKDRVIGVAPSGEESSPLPAQNVRHLRPIDV